MPPFSLVFGLLSLMCDVHAARRLTSHAKARHTHWRLQADGKKAPSGPHKCTIRWPGREGTPEKVASFGVTSCTIQCKQTNPDYHQDLMFSLGIKTAQLEGKCSCQTLAGRELFKLSGYCEDDERAAAKICFRTYKELVTDDLSLEAGKEGRTVRHNYALTKDGTFDYGDCEKKACADEGCTEVTLPSLWENLNEHERKFLSKKIVDQANGGHLQPHEKEIIEQLGDEDLKAAGELVLEERSGKEHEDTENMRAELSIEHQEGVSIESLQTSGNTTTSTLEDSTTTTIASSVTNTTSPEDTESKRAKLSVEHHQGVSVEPLQTSGNTSTSTLEDSTTTTIAPSVTNTTSPEEINLKETDMTSEETDATPEVEENSDVTPKEGAQSEDCKARIEAIVRFGEAHEAVFEKCSEIQNDIMDGRDSMALSEQGRSMLCSEKCAVDKTMTPPDLEAIRSDCEDKESRSAIGELLMSFKTATLLHDELLACPEPTTTIETTTTIDSTITTTMETTSTTEPMEMVDCEKEIEGFWERMSDLQQAFIQCNLQHSDVSTLDGVTTVSEDGQTKLCAKECQESSVLLSGFPDMGSIQESCTDEVSVEELSSEARLAKYSMLKAMYQEWNTCAVVADIHKVVMDPNCETAKQIFSRMDFQQENQLKYDEVLATLTRYRAYQEHELDKAGLDAIKETSDRIDGALDALSKEEPIQESGLISIMLGDKAVEC